MTDDETTIPNRDDDSRHEEEPHDCATHGDPRTEGLVVCGRYALAHPRVNICFPSGSQTDDVEDARVIGDHGPIFPPILPPPLTEEELDALVDDTAPFDDDEEGE